MDETLVGGEVLQEDVFEVEEIVFAARRRECCCGHLSRWWF